MRRKVLVSEDSGACYCIGEPINHGVFSSVYKCYGAQSTYLQYAVKIYNRSVLDRFPDGKQVLCNEVTALYAIQSPYICNKVDMFDSDRNVYIIVEYAHNGNLLEFIKKTTSSEGARVRDAIARKWLQQLLWGLADIHAAGFAHCDIKPENLLIDQHKNLKICDFGFCVKYSGANGELLHQDSGTPLYAAPELLTGNGYDGFSTDVWSTGITLYVMLTGTLPFFARTSEELFEKIQKAHIPENPKISASAMHFLRCCLDVDPKKRWTVAQLLHHPYCRGLAKFGRGLGLSVGARGGGADRKGSSGVAALGYNISQFVSEGAGALSDAPSSVATGIGDSSSDRSADTAHLTPLSTQTAAFPTVPSLEHADALFFGASHSFTCLRENGGRILNERQLMFWKEFAMKRKARKRREQKQQTLQQQEQRGEQQQGEDDKYNNNNNNNNNSNNNNNNNNGGLFIYSNAANASSADSMEVFHIDETALHDEDDAVSNKSSQSMRDKLRNLHALPPPRSPTFDNNSNSNGPNRISPSSSDGMRRMGLRKAMSADSLDDDGAASAVSGTSSSRTPRTDGGGGGGSNVSGSSATRRAADSRRRSRQSRSSSLLVSGEQRSAGGSAAKYQQLSAPALAHFNLTGGGGSDYSGSRYHLHSQLFSSAAHLRTQSGEHASGDETAAMAVLAAAAASRQKRHQQHQRTISGRSDRSGRLGASGGSNNLPHTLTAPVGKQPTTPPSQSYDNNSVATSATSAAAPPGGGGGGGTTGRAHSRGATPQQNQAQSQRGSNRQSPVSSGAASGGGVVSAQAELNRIMNVQRPSIYLRLEYAHLKVLVRWCLVVIQFVVWAVLRLLFNIKLENYIAVEGPLARFLRVEEVVEEKEKED